MSIDYKQLEALVREAMFTGGGINEPSAPEGVPHRMPAADTDDNEQDMGDEEANEKYEIALAAREATEKLVEALDEPIYDGAYEHAFKATRALGEALNELVGVGAHPMPVQRVVALPPDQQRYVAGGAMGDYAGGAMVGMGDGGFGGMQEVSAGGEDALAGFGTKAQTQGDHAKQTLSRSRDVGAGKILQGVDTKERGILSDIEKILTKIADDDDLTYFRSELQSFMKRLIATSAGRTRANKNK